jgi:hypothetical protein
VRIDNEDDNDSIIIACYSTHSKHNASCNILFSYYDSRCRFVGTSRYFTNGPAIWYVGYTSPLYRGVYRTVLVGADMYNVEDYEENNWVFLEIRPTCDKNIIDVSYYSSYKWQNTSYTLFIQLFERLP